MTNRTPALLLVTGLLFAAGTTAQTYLTPAYQQITWQAGTQLHVQPGATAAGNQTELTIHFDATSGARLHELRHKVAGAQLRAFPADPGGLGVHSGLWAVRLVQTPIPAVPLPIVEITPTASVAVFTLGGTNTTTSAVLVWQGLALPSSTENLIVELKLTATQRVSTDSAVTAEILCRRTVPTPGSVLYQMESVDIQVTLQDDASGGIGDHARVYVPTHESTAIPANNVAIDLMRFMATPDAQAWNHPGYHAMQFAGFHHPGRSSSVFIGTEDYRGYRKFFRYWSEPVTATPRYALAWRARYVPEHDDNPTDDVFQAPYTTLIHTVVSPERTWWYDVAAFYRSLIQSQPSGPNNNIVTAPVGSANSLLNPVVADNCVVMLSSHVAAPGGSPYQPVYDEVRAIQKLLNAANPASIPSFLQIQEWMNGTSAPPISRAPMAPDTMPEPAGGDPAFRAHVSLPAVAATARSQDSIATILYTFPGLFRITGSWPMISPNRALWTRDAPAGTKDIFWHPGFPAPQARLDLALSSGNPSWFANTIVPSIYASVPDMRGVYEDAIAGGGPALRYKSLPGFPVVAGPFHGGFVAQEGRIAAFDNARTQLATLIGTTPNSTHPDIPVVFGEVTEEYLAGHMDLSARGLHLYPGQGMLADPDPLNTNWQSHDLLPPTWNLVYHETAPAYAAGMQLTLHAYNQMVTSGVPAATATADYLDMFAYAHGLILVNGMNPLTFTHQATNPVQDRMFDHLSANGFGPTVAGNANKLQIATSVRDMIRGFHACRTPQLGGPFLTKGRRERPLREDHGTTIGGGAFAIDRGYSPMTKIWDWMRANYLTYTEFLPIEFLPFTSQVNDRPGSNPATHGMLVRPGPWPAGIGDSPKVVHSVWSDPAQPNKLVIAFWNWSAAPARWEGVFVPTLYGAGGASYSVETIDTVSGISTTQGGLFGTSTLVFDVPAAGQVGLSAIPQTFPPTGPIGARLPPRVPHLVVITW